MRKTIIRTSPTQEWSSNCDAREWWIRLAYIEHNRVEHRSLIGKTSADVLSQFAEFEAKHNES